MDPHNHIDGIEISPAALIAARPARAVTGFAPGGRVSTHMWGANRSVFHRAIAFGNLSVERVNIAGTVCSLVAFVVRFR